jgi:hypothetical protein
MPHIPGSGAVAVGAKEGPWPPYCLDPSEIVNVLENCRKIVNVVGNCQSCRRGGGGGGGGEDLNCCRPENILVCRKNRP